MPRQKPSRDQLFGLMQQLHILRSNGEDSLNLRQTEASLAMELADAWVVIKGQSKDMGRSPIIVLPVLLGYVTDASTFPDMPFVLEPREDEARFVCRVSLAGAWCDLQCGESVRLLGKHAVAMRQTESEARELACEISSVYDRG